MRGRGRRRICWKAAESSALASVRPALKRLVKVTASERGLWASGWSGGVAVGSKTAGADGEVDVAGVDPESVGGVEVRTPLARPHLAVAAHLAQDRIGRGWPGRPRRGRRRSWRGR